MGKMLSLKRRKYKEAIAKLASRRKFDDRKADSVFSQIDVTFWALGDLRKIESVQRARIYARMEFAIASKGRSWQS